MKNIQCLLFPVLLIIISAITTMAQAPAATVRIGEQVWDAKNLAVTTFANGEKIDQIQSPEEWIQAGKAGKPAWCFYENNAITGKTYGILYNWFAVADPRGLAPKGWHVATKYEWLPMLDYLGGKGVAGKTLKSKTLWEAVSGIDRNGKDSIGFNALPAGMRFIDSGKFDDRGTRCQLWTATENDSERAAIVVLGISNTVTVSIANKGFGYSVRCIKD